ncbi:carbohydrate ABC transporter permease [Paenibacillus xerothermodurans]|uniref:Carbohydrate ABC transporter permease n=1 Tax=Paenibacillus xerothermodurans TaxID=1977292 RepID=A0A2W1NDE8_PAEXE|nr:carbohydrate ABC transporter permease [Paenibacillus xerothermodurans]PZE21640.1 carbohydrate ABC transporter permease [Paenibacillus xerothermodurans]
MSRTLRSVIYHLFVAVLGLFMVYPILWTLASSLKPEHEIFVNASSLIPSTLEWQNYAKGWKGFGTIGFDVFFRNSALVTSMVVTGTLFSSALVAFGFARLQFSLRKALFACLMVTMMLPGQVTMIPQYILFQKLGWVNTYNPLIVPAFIGGTPFFIFLLIQFIRGIPRELDESAVIDGCSAYGIFWRIILPLSTPALVTVAIFSFYWTWDDFLGPLIYLNDVKKHTISLGLRMFADPSSVTAWGPMFSMSVLSLLPQFLIFLFFQKYIVEGIATTGIKG